MAEVIVENSRFQQAFFAPDLDEGRLYDVIVIGSGVGGGILADQLSDLGATVLVLKLVWRCSLPTSPICRAST